MTDPRVDAYLDEQPEPQRSTLAQLRALLARVLPHGQETIRYGVPCVTIRDKAVAGYGGFTDHCSYLPMSGSVLEVVRDLPDWCSPTKGSVRFPVDRPLPVGVVRKLVRARLDEFSQVHDGKRLDLYDDGAVKAEGSMQDGELHGAWRWYRQDGSLQRVGRFSHGTQVGTWETWDRDGKLVSSKRL